MADVWTTPLTWTAGNLSVANLNQYVRDNMDALKQGLVGDASADADIKQSIKSGTLAARPAASQAGRLYTATNIFTQFEDNGTGWEHRSGPGVYDDFNRANVEPMDTANSGHTWTEDEGDIDIVTNRAQAITLVASRAVMLAETGGIIRTGQYQCQIRTGAVAASVNVGLVLKRAAGVLLYVQVHGSLGLRLVQGITVLSTSAFSPGPNADYILTASMIGSVVHAEVHAGAAFGAVLHHASKTDVQDYAPTATSCGLLFGSTQDAIDGFAAKFN